MSEMKEDKSLQEGKTASFIGPDGQRRGFLFSLREDGSPTCHAMMVSIVNGKPVFNTYRASVKTKNLMRPPGSASVLLLNDWQESPSKAITVQGHVREADEADWPDSGTTGNETKPSTTGVDVPKGITKQVAERVSDAKRIILELVPANTKGAE